MGLFNNLLAPKGASEQPTESKPVTVSVQRGQGQRKGKPAGSLAPLSARKMPAQKPHRSEQTVGTPWAFIHATQKLIGQPIDIDLAATSENAKAHDYLGPAVDSLLYDWHGLPGVRWLNPPFGNIGPWAKKCAEETDAGNKTLLLVPAAVGTNWFRDWVYGKAEILFLSPRITFEGHEDAYPKDLMLCIYGRAHGIALWNWRTGEIR